MKIALKWINVENELPKTTKKETIAVKSRTVTVQMSDTVLALTGTDMRTAALVRGEGEEFWTSELGDCSPTHWFPIPPMPENWSPDGAIDCEVLGFCGAYS